LFYISDYLNNSFKEISTNNNYTDEMNYTIYNIPKYNTIRTKIKCLTGSIDIISDAIKTDNSYHNILNDTDTYVLFLDLDHILNDTVIFDFIEYLSGILEIDPLDIKYTESLKNKEYSYHLTIPALNATLDILKSMIMAFKECKKDLTKYIDESVYKNNQLFRLPNQTNKDKSISHIIKNGSEKDFILDYIHIESHNITVISDVDDATIKLKASNKSTVKIIKAADYDLINMLNELDNEYLTNYNKWSIITNIFKGINKYEIWNEWSKKSDKYSKHKNDCIWKSNRIIKFNIGYLINITHYKLFKKIDEYNIKPNNSMCSKYLSDILTYDDIRLNDNIIIESCTGTGKTTAISKYLEQYTKQNPKYKILSIIDRVTLADQHIKSFKDYNIKINDYRNKFIPNENYIVCINSLLSTTIKKDDIKNYIIYIDEINSFLKHITHNTTLDKDLKKIFTKLMCLIKNCHKVIVSDAIINDNISSFLNCRKGLKQYFIRNEFKKYENIKAIRIRDENVFKSKLEQNLRDNQYFSFGCDSCTTVEQYYYTLYELATEEQKENMILFTANHKFNITNASEQFKNKFLFFSPAIETAVDISLIKLQDVFIYIKGATIDPSSSFQQATRTRNINTLYYFCEKVYQVPKYMSLEDTKEQYRHNIIDNDIITSLCNYMNDDEESIVSENTFFKLFCYNEYLHDCYNTDKLKHFELILLNNKFDISEKGQSTFIDQEVKIEMIDMRKEINEEEFNKFINDEIESKILTDRINTLNLTNKDDIIFYKDVIMDPFKIKDHFDTTRLFKSDMYIDMKLLNQNDKNFKVRNLDTTYNKIKILRELEKKFNIKKLDVEYKTKGDINLLDTEYELIKKVFRYNTKNKPITYDTFKLLYIDMIKSITNKDIIINTRKRNGAVKINNYSLNMEYINNQLTLNKFYNPNLKGYCSDFNLLLNLNNTDIISNNKDNSLLDQNIFLD